MAGKYMRSVSIIGVGDTPQGKFLETPELKDLSTYEMFAYACQEAMQDAGVKAKDIDELVYCEVVGLRTNGHVLGNHVQRMEWIGMKGKPGYHIENACATSYKAIESATNDIASGKCDIVLVAGSEMGQEFFGPWEHAYSVHPIKDIPGWWQVAMCAIDPAYHRFNGGPGSMPAAIDYGRSYLYENKNVTVEQYTAALNGIAIAERRAAALNPKAYCRTTYEQLAKDAGYASAMDYLNDPKNNPQASSINMRKAWASPHTNMAGAVILCASDIAQKFHKRPIEILACESASYSTAVADSHHKMNREAIQKAYDFSGVKPEEIDLLQCCDMLAWEDLMTAEDCGYLPKGEGWRYCAEGRTAFDGDKPINTHGGDLSAGHAYGVAGFPYFAEAVRQMRGECGERQMKVPPRTVMVRGMGGSVTTVATILRAQD
ncbi:MAG: thiolase family protein [Oscillospiraceae bacterium]